MPFISMVVGGVEDFLPLMLLLIGSPSLLLLLLVVDDDALFLEKAPTALKGRFFFAALNIFVLAESL